MGRIGGIGLCLSWLLLLPCVAQADVSAQIFEKLAQDLAQAVTESKSCQKDNLTLAKAKSVAEASMLDIEAVQVVAEVRHDHDRFIFGSDYQLRVHISNPTRNPLYIPSEEAEIFVPSELMLKSGSDACEKKFGVTEVFGSTGKLSVLIPPRSERVVVWNCSQARGVLDVVGDMFKKLFFRPDVYTFVASIPFAYHRPSSNAGMSVDSGVIVKTTEAKVAAELDAFFISLCSIVGAIIAVFARMAFQMVDNYTIRKVDWPMRYGQEQRRIWYETIAFFCICFLLPPLLVAGANITQKFDHGVSIKIFDFFGAALAGFIVQMLIMKLGQPALDRLLGSQP